MRLIGTINIQSSLLVSGISATGLGVLLSFAQVKTPSLQKSESPFEEKKTEIPKADPTLKSKQEEQQKDIQTFQIFGFKKSVFGEELEKDLAIRNDLGFDFAKFGANWSPFPSRQNVEWNHQSDTLFSDQNTGWTGARFIGGKRGSVQLNSSILPALPFGDLAPVSRGRKSDPLGITDKTGINQSTLDTLELSYTVLPGVEAILKTGNSLPYTADQKDQGYSMAGFSFNPNKYINTRIVSGSSFGNSSLSSNRFIHSSNPSNNAQPISGDPNIANNPVLRNQAMGTGGGRVIEWQANVQPVKRLSFQTSILNKERERGIYNPEAARFSMFIDFTKIILNVRYSYSADPNTKNNGLYITPESDATTLGLTMLLDPAGRYSLFFGNNFYNLLSQKNAGINQVEEPLRSFSASFRGKTSFQNAIFFMNFRNYLSKGVIYTDVGPFRLPAFSQYYTEYFTSLGIELSF
ncbi:hypothetical protein AB3N59_18925 [Leptospira sp. WS92.C1]